MVSCNDWDVAKDEDNHYGEDHSWEEGPVLL